MQTPFQARWISKDRLHQLRKSGSLGHGLLIDSYKGWIMVEPVGSDLGDGDVMSAQAADYELDPAWCPGSKTKLKEARKLLGLEVDEMADRLVSAR